MDVKQKIESIKNNTLMINSYNSSFVEEEFNALMESVSNVLNERDIDLQITYIKEDNDQLLVLKNNNRVAYMLCNFNNVSMFADKNKESILFANKVACYVSIYFEEINKKDLPEHIRTQSNLEKVKKYKK